MEQSEKRRIIIVFQLGQEHFGLDIGLVKSIEKVSGITSVPQVNDIILGVIKLRGGSFPIIDLKRRLGLGHTSLSENTKVLFVQIDGANIGLAVDTANDVIDLGSKSDGFQIKPFSGPGSEYIEGIAKLDTFVCLLNLKSILEFDELIDLK
ncbi:chemotaxis protein CheW [Bacillus sp. REN3]|uniref:chemotaxis protein CheW n=1 Tax=Bacillus sp. REN3 TaxID=2802440 RepID=UPI0032BFCF70